MYYNNDSDSDNESVEIDLNKVDDEEIVNTNGFKRRSEDEVWLEIIRDRIYEIDKKIE